MNRFGDYTPHGNICIGETLDQLLNGHCNVQSIPKISVAQRNGKWFTSDNRRLWVFRKAEEIGFLKTIYVNKTYSIKDDKFTTENGGTSIRVRGGSPGGSLWRTWKPKRPSTTKTHVNYNSNRVAQKYHRSHVEYDVRKNNERNEEVPYRFNSNVETTRPAALPSRFNWNVETTRPAALPSRLIRMLKQHVLQRNLPGLIRMLRHVLQQCLPGLIRMLKHHILQRNLSGLIRMLTQHALHHMIIQLMI